MLLENEIFIFFYSSIFKIRMSLTHFRQIFLFNIHDFLMFRTIQSLSNATVGGWVVVEAFLIRVTEKQGLCNGCLFYTLYFLMVH